ncbi:MAG: translation initiation factor IF-2, partial [Clostridiales bacterium]|nr:translation initiation factor IF-2 [Clostridiales bacterium]
MPRNKISKVAKELNVSLSTVTDFLRSKNIEVDDNPNTRIDEDAEAMLKQHFSTDMKAKREAEQFLADRQKDKEPAPKAVHTPKAEVKPAPATPSPAPAAPAPAVEEKKPEQPAPATPKVEQPVVEAKKSVDTTVPPIPADKAGTTAPMPKAGKPAPQQDSGSQEPAPAKPQAEPVKTQQPVQPTPAEQPRQPQNNAPKQPAKKADQAQPAAPVVGPRIVGHVDLDSKGNPIKPKPQPQPKNELPKKPQQAKNIEKKPTMPENKPSAAESKPQASEEPEIFTLGTPTGMPTINVIGKIDLNSINQSTRPKKKSKEERRNERIAKSQNNGQGGNANNQGQGDRKKRKRIGGKEKIDIEKTGQQGENNSSKQERKRRDEKNSKKDPRRQPAHVEVSDEDVQKQVKETLARLTSKGNAQKKGVKWRKEKREAASNRAHEAAELEAAESKTLKLTEFVTANDLASMMNVPVNQVIATCMNIGVMVSINQRLDAETINIVADEFGYTTEYVSAEVVEAIHQESDSDDELEDRPPIVTVMGHVDHGKTSLLDYIRNANVIAGEAGGITQHIGAYNVKLSDGRHITFLDTPGHEAFTAMRARGAKVTDLCIIIVAADDNVMPQTVEAINHASAAGVPIVFAINKIDKPHANPDKIKEELAAMNYLVEDWGGKYQSQDISAKKGIGVPELMEKVLLEAEMLDLKANPNRKATGSIIESSLDKGRGYVATVLVQNGTLRVGDVVLAGTHFGRIKAMFNERNQRIKEAGPATPALVLGLNGAPTAGDTFNVMETEQEAREIANKREQLQRELGLRTKKILTLEDIGRRRAIGNFQELNIIVKGDVDGSIEALSDSLIKLSTEEIQVNVLHKAVGEISESDV